MSLQGEEYDRGKNNKETELQGTKWEGLENVIFRGHMTQGTWKS